MTDNEERLTNEDEQLTCDFCGWEAPEPEWFVTDKWNYGQKEPHTLCQFCYRSHSASAWLAGLSDDYNITRNTNAGLNLLRWTLLGKSLED